MESIIRLFLLLLQAYGILFVLICAHRLRKRYGLDGFFILVGGVLIYMWWVSRLGIDALTIGEISIPVATLAQFSSVFAALLLVYISDGVRLARRLILAVLTLQGLFLFLEVLTHTTIYFSPPLPYALPEPFLTLHWREIIWSSVALVADMFIVIVVYQFIQNRFTKTSTTLKLWGALSIALIADSLIFLVGTSFGSPNFGALLLSQSIGKLLMATALAPALAFYIRSEAGEEIEQRDTFNIFGSVNLLTRSLHHVKTKYTTLLEGLNEGVAVLNMKGFVVEANDAFWKMTGYSKADLGKLHYSALFHHEDRAAIVAAHSLRLQRNSASDVFSARGLDKQDRTLIYHAFIHLLKEENEKTGFMLVLKDETKLRKLESDLDDYLILAGRREMKYRVARAIAEQTGQSAGFLSENREAVAGAVDPEAAAALADLCRTTEHLPELLTELDTPATIEEDRIPVNELFDTALEILSERIKSCNTEISTRYAKPTPHITCIRQRMIQVFCNLVDSSLYWACQSDSEPELQIRAQISEGKLGRRVEITLGDNGPDLDEDERAERYDPYRADQEAPKGSIGLNLCRLVIAECRGEIRQIRNGDFTEVCVSFPADDTVHIRELILS